MKVTKSSPIYAFHSLVFLHYHNDKKKSYSYSSYWLKKISTDGFIFGIPQANGLYEISFKKMVPCFINENIS